MKKVAIVQSNYIPWKGYFDLIREVDVFVIYDIVQYTKNDWRNRNKIIANGVAQWLTIPVSRQRLGQRINETLISDSRWSDKHWKTLQQNYSGCEHFEWCSSEIADVYSGLKNELCLSKVNFSFIEKVSSMLDLSTEFRFSEEFDLPEDRQDRLIEICRALDCDTYVSGGAANSYIEEDRFRRNDIDVEWFDYEGYNPYNQLSTEFTHQVSILDMMFNLGEKTLEYIRRDAK